MQIMIYFNVNKAFHRTWRYVYLYFQCYFDVIIYLNIIYMLTYIVCLLHILY